MNIDNAMVDLPDFPEPSSLVSMCRGAYVQTGGFIKRRYRCAIWRREKGSIVGLAGLFDTTALGVFNGKEHGILKMRGHVFEFSRKKQRGIWWMDAEPIGEIRLSWLNWQLYMGKIEVMRKDGTHLCDVRFPWGCSCAGGMDSFGRFCFPNGRAIEFVIESNDANFERCTAGGIARNMFDPESSMRALRPVATMESLFPRKYEQALSGVSSVDRVLLFCTAIWARSIINTTAP